MAISGNWNARVATQAGALKQGSGWNPIHAMRWNAGRSDKPPALIFTDTVTQSPVPSEMLDDMAPTFNDYADDDNQLWSYGFQTGTADYPALGEHDVLPDPNWPSWGPYVAGLPGGSRIRTFDKGSEASNTPKQQPYETVTEGWENKQRGDEDIAVPADDSQLLMQTSMTQRNKVRAGSQSSGTASEHDAPIASHTAGKKIKPWSGLLRHYDMQPREQNLIIRPWWARNAYTGPTGELWNEANPMYVSDPIQRDIPSDPELGPIEQGSSISSSGVYGYVPEDMVW